MKLLIKNKRAYYDYEILDKVEAGIVLTGGEVKSIMAKQANFTGSYVTISRDQQATLLNAFVNKWPFDQTAGYDPQRTRGLLLHRKEILRLQNELQQERAILVPLGFFVSNHKIKVLVGVAKPLKKFDKRRREQERTEKREIQKLRKTSS